MFYDDLSSLDICTIEEETTIDYAIQQQEELNYTIHAYTMIKSYTESESESESFLFAVAMPVIIFPLIVYHLEQITYEEIYNNNLHMIIMYLGMIF